MVALAVALPLVAVAGSPAQAAVTEPFFADHTRGYAYSYTRGTLDWDPVATTVIPRVTAPTSSPPSFPA